MMGQEGRWGSADREGETSREVMGSAPRQPGPALEAALGDRGAGRAGSGAVAHLNDAETEGLRSQLTH